MIPGGFKNMNADQIIQCILVAMLKLEKITNNDLKNKLDRGGYTGTAQTLYNAILLEIQNRIDADAITLQNANNYTNLKVSTAYKVKGSVANYISLPISGQEVGDVWNLLDTGMNYVWTGVFWDALGTTVDISGKENKSEKNQINGYAGLDINGKISKGQIPTLLKWGYVTAANGGTRTIALDEDILSVEGSGVIAAFTINLPLSLTEAKEVSITFNVNVTNLNIGSSGVIDYVPLSAKAYDTWTWIYEPIGNQWIVKSYWNGDLGAQITALPNKATITDIDYFAISDGLSSGLPKKVTALNLYNYIGLNNTTTVYVEANGNDSKAKVGDNRKAYLTIDAALDALPSTGGVVKIGTGSFLSPTRTKIKDNTKFLGSGKPYPNMTISYVSQSVKPTISSPTKLVGGTILQGEFVITGKNYIEIYNLGVDVGKEWIESQDGVVKNGLWHASNLISNDIDNNLVPPSKGLIVENISSLNYSATAATHAVVLENITDAKIDKVSTYFGTHGVVIKGRGVNLSNVIAYGHSSNGVVIKADNYAYCSDVNVSNVYITSISDFDGGGFRLVSSAGGILSRVNVNNLNVEHTTYGLKDENDGVDGVNINNATFFNIQGHGVFLSEFAKRATLNNIIIDGAGMNGIQLNSKSLDAVKTLTNCTVRNAAVNGAYFYAVGGAINLGNINVTGRIAIDGGATSNVRGFNVKASTTFTGALVFDASGGTDYIATIDGTGKINKSRVLIDSSATSGTYTPTLTAVQNVSSVTLRGEPTYTRIGNILTVSVSFDVSVVSSAFTQFSVTLPVNMAIGSTKKIGSVNIGSSVPVVYYPAIGSIVNSSTFNVSFTAQNTSVCTGNFTFQYDVTQ